MLSEMGFVRLIYACICVCVCQLISAIVSALCTVCFESKVLAKQDMSELVLETIELNCSHSHTKRLCFFLLEIVGNCLRLLCDD
ncbi:hypothetical protein BpHYR1_037415 [Brachionus plicatilis]|uniref:Uncharacterized protein n=1 Tax=Brachionus plicatilis TaxID=10195 RepID=A0A3M7SQ71_BRAPC|nr:hypothetical protein BpHYR1_037415 [Brachionus plicatilis]